MNDIEYIYSENIYSVADIITFPYFSVSGWQTSYYHDCCKTDSTINIMLIVNTHSILDILKKMWLGTIEKK